MANYQGGGASRNHYGKWSPKLKTDIKNNQFEQNRLADEYEGKYYGTALKKRAQQRLAETKKAKGKKPGLH